MSRLFLGVDTSCYTTSVCCVSEEGIVFERRTMLSVPLGERGLRQSDAVFQHVKNLPPLIDALFAAVDRRTVAAVGVSVKPTAEEESYMPVFLAGRLAAVSLANALGVPYFETTHQAGHVRAAMFGNEAALLSGGFLALHLSGGTTDVLRVSLDGGMIAGIERLGGCEDLHAGQFVDRVGVRMGLPFPCGAELERLANAAVKRSVKLPSIVRGVTCSLSGPESAAQRLLDAGETSEEAAYAVYDCLARTIAKLLANAMEQTGLTNVLLSGGVSGSALLRELLRQRMGRELLYAPPGLSADNAAGAALIARDLCSK